MSEERTKKDQSPDLSSKSDPELKKLLEDLCQEEEQISYKRRIIHGKIDILRAEMVKRLKGKRTRGEKLFSKEDINKLGEILARETTTGSKSKVDEDVL